MIVIAPRLLMLLTGHFANAMALWPFILVRNHETKESIVTIHHEKIHCRQQLELMIFPFYLLYISFYIYYRIKGFNHFNAYMSIPFEREAYQYESDLQYLDKRPWWHWVRFVGG